MNIPPQSFHWLTVVFGFAVAGCGLFEELQSADSAEGSSSGTDTGSGGSDTGDTTSCRFPRDDRCRDQDTVQSCTQDGDELATYGCNGLCTGSINFTCLTIEAGRHGCWCVAPGPQKTLACHELETCLRACAEQTTETCANTCFARTTEATVRLYGSVLFCAHDRCHDTCIDDPQTCASCIEEARRDGDHGCGLERSLCDLDMSEPLIPTAPPSQPEQPTALQAW